jgi:SOS-response transcriptional repressor LexA
MALAIRIMSGKSQASFPEWSRQVEALRHRMTLSQSEFGVQLSRSAMAISRWERGILEPTGAAYIKLGNLAGDPLCWYFWRRAGLSTADVMRVLPDVNRRLSQIRSAPVQIVHAGVRMRRAKQRAEFVAVPLLPVHAATLGEEIDKEADLDQIRPERLLAAPTEWCPHPTSTICIRVKGNSMSPLILDDYIIAVDTSEVRHDTLVGHIVVAQNIEKGLLVSRLIRFDHTEALISDHRGYDSVLLATKKWRIVGKVLWWTGKSR